MKRFIKGFFAALLLLTVAVFAAACANNEVKSDPGAEVTVFVQLNDRNPHYDPIDDKLAFDYGEEISIEQNDVVVYYSTSDGENEYVEDFTIDTAPLGEGDAGTYYIDVSFALGGKSYTRAITVTIRPHEIVVPFLHGEIVMDYTGEEIDIISVIDDRLGAEGKTTISDMIRGGIITVGESSQRLESEINSASEDGESYYVVYLDCADNYVFTLETFDSPLYGVIGERQFRFSWRIAPRILTVPVVLNPEIAYDGEAHAIELAFAADDESYVTVYDDRTGEEDRGNSYTEPGIYNFTVTALYGAFFEENGAKVTSVTVSMEIK